jgi:hypothetical protein
LVIQRGTPTMDGMPRNKKPTSKLPNVPLVQVDRHKPSKQCRIPLSMATELESIAEKEWTTFATQVALAVKFYLQHKKGGNS